MTTARAATLLLCVALGTALFTNAEVASAKVLRWDLQNVTFEDGGTASGFFLFDADIPFVNHTDRPPTTGLVSWDIAVEGEAPPCPPECFPPYRFTPSSTSYGAADASSLGLVGPSFYDPGGRNSLHFGLGFDTPLSDAGGAVQVTGGQSWSYFCCTNSRSVITGQVVAIPEPSEALFLALGLAALVSFSTWRARRDDGRAAASKVDASR
jgi:hypothetical protein